MICHFSQILSLHSWSLPSCQLSFTTIVVLLYMLNSATTPHYRSLTSIHIHLSPLYAVLWNTHTFSRLFRLSSFVPPLSSPSCPSLVLVILSFVIHIFYVACNQLPAYPDCSMFVYHVSGVQYNKFSKLLNNLSG
ncbi:hypothetical protein BDY19DRAFT_213398 [Irpex rosettiformis]|uniref:Uncharacterized protein n=1 Tax=Irpex rosettiformis TaxID=378272 RepID=A0ACB8U1A4_9APHY|nr:hypothetical protein BDY19DRAFT_213398 [Irpex rosettiformis]